MEPPYGVIWDCLKRGNVVPFLGSGHFVSRPRGRVAGAEFRLVCRMAGS